MSPQERVRELFTETRDDKVAIEYRRVQSTNPNLQKFIAAQKSTYAEALRKPFRANIIINPVDGSSFRSISETSVSTA